MQHDSQLTRTESASSRTATIPTQPIPTISGARQVPNTSSQIQSVDQQRARLRSRLMTTDYISRSAKAPGLTPPPLETKPTTRRSASTICLRAGRGFLPKTMSCDGHCTAAEVSSYYFSRRATNSGRPVSHSCSPVYLALRQPGGQGECHWLVLAHWAAPQAPHGAILGGVIIAGAASWLQLHPARVHRGHAYS
jgi:hypothetical protein